MKQAILITAYKNFEHLYDIIDFFDDRFEFYIHIDKKTNINKNTIERIISSNKVKHVSRKYKVNWAGRNHLKSILHLSGIALKNKDLGYFHLISGHDYPIKSCLDFVDFFKNNDVSYLSNYEMPLSQWTNGGMDRLEYYNLYDIFDAKKYRKHILKFVEIQKNYGVKRSISKRVPKLYGGDTWWSLKRDALSFLIDYTKKNKYLLNRFRYTFCSEEIYVQTVIMNSEYASKVVNNSLRYIDWQHRNGNIPANLDMSDFNKIKDSDCFFARKFEYPVSNDLKNVLTTNLRQ